MSTSRRLFCCLIIHLSRFQTEMLNFMKQKPNMTAASSDPAGPACLDCLVGGRSSGLERREK